jgi:hypothetical protein
MERGKCLSVAKADRAHLARNAMLNERQTLAILGWTISSLCIVIFTLSAVAMPH